MPERDLRRDQYLDGLVWVEFERVSCHLSLLCWEMEEEMLSLSWEIRGLVGSVCRRLSRSRMRGGASGGRLGVWCLRKPAGMLCLEAIERVWRKERSPEEQEVGGGREEKSLSVSSRKLCQLARLKLMKVLILRGRLISVGGREMRIGRWSERRVVMVCQEREVARWAEQRERSGEEGCPNDGSRVGESSLRRQRLLLLRASTTASPRVAAVMSRVMEYQAG